MENQKQKDALLLKLANLTMKEAMSGKLDDLVREACEIMGVEYKDATKPWE
jgi:hypothetical protein